MEKSRTIGAQAEAAAERYLRGQGYQILGRNYCIRGGEIDLIARVDDYLVFVEVKMRKNTAYGQACEAVTLPKQRRLSRTAQHYLLRHPELASLYCRFDVIEVYGFTQGEILHITNAFDAC